MSNKDFKNTDFHQPVLLQEMIDAIAPKDNEIYVDCTFGAGGYSSAILEKTNGTLYAIDRDELAKNFAQKLKDKFQERFQFLPGQFSNIKELLEEKEISQVDGIVLDIGVSSMQLDDHERGFSFDSTARLDMRMDKTQKLSAYEVINEFDEAKLAAIIKEYGEEKKAKRIASKIVKTRNLAPITSCLDLARIVRSLYFGYFKTDPATRTFQAIRIFVNQELEELKKALTSSVQMLKKGGRIVVVTFHSLEDKIVKDFFKKESGNDKSYSRYQPEVKDENQEITLYLKKSSAISPSSEEIAINPRSRSAKLRVAYKK